MLRPNALVNIVFARDLLGATGVYFVRLQECSATERPVTFMRFRFGTIATIIMLGLTGGLSAQENGSTTTEEQAAPASAVQVKATVPATVNHAAPGIAAVPGDSHVRIVRLSEAQGTIAMDRGTGKGYEQTMQNMPIVEGAKLETDDGYAEVEFEDGSALRLAPDSRVEFPQLVLHSSGVKATTVNVLRGTVYVSLENSKDNEFTLKAGQAAMAISPSTHMRVEITWPKMMLSVFSGSVAVQSGGATTMVEKKQTATLDATDASKVEVTKKIAEATFDAWDKEQNDYHKRYAAVKGNAYAGGGYGYGVSDLNYYGSFVNGGCGMMWQPYFASAAWDPYGNGAWAYYPGAGYSWVSPYPWGWLPYHSGSWSFCQGMGWGWQPGGNWRGLANVAPGVMGQPLVGNGGATLVTAGAAQPVGLPRPPSGPTTSTLVMQNRTALVSSKESQPGNFVFQQNSAGMGVPRGSLGDLKGVSNGVGHHGFANMQVYSERMGPAGNPAHPMTNAPMALRQGSPQQNGNWQNGANAGALNQPGAAPNQPGGLNSQAPRGGGSSASSSSSGGGFSHGGGGGQTMHAGPPAGGSGGNSNSSGSSGSSKSK